MTSAERHMTNDQTEAFLRFSRRGLFVILLTFLVLGATALAIAVWPNSALAMWPHFTPWLFPVLMTIAFIALRAPLKGRWWKPGSPDVEAILQDEFRQANLARAQHGAFITVLVAQVPLGLLLANLPDLAARRALVAMVGTTIALGMATLTGLFLIFDREARDE